MTTHSQLPWKLEDADCIIDNRGKTTAVCVNEFSEANASFIVRAVNNHERLVSVCKEALDALQSQGIYKDRIERLQQALQSAEEK